MRLLIILPLLLAIYSAPHAVDGENTTAASDQIQFTLPGATSSSYKKFIGELQNKLTAGTKRVYKIPVLKPVVNPNDRFILVNLVNYGGKSITIAIDVTNAYVVGYLTGTNSYFFKGEDVAASLLFPGSYKRSLPYGNGYTDLEKAANVLRVRLPLGIPPLDNAITNLLQKDEQAMARSFLVVIQMVSEAARFKYIEKRVRDTIGKEFKPDLAVLSLENKWIALSKQIQLAQKNKGKFPSPVVVSLPNGNPKVVSDVHSSVVKDMALLVYNKDVGEAGK